ncbi:MAG: uroporphyrinogen decarboxylase [Terriglobia bacterium]
MAETEKAQQGFAGLCVAAFEGRRAGDMEQLILKHGGRPLLAPSMAEVPLTQNVSALEFGSRLLRQEIAVVLFQTGGGTRNLFEVLATSFPQDQLKEALRRITIVARGPKPVEALREQGVPVSIAVPDPGTWREFLEIVDNDERFPPLPGLTVAVQESGVPNFELIEELKTRGAHVLQVPVYRWTLPQDTQPLERAIRALIEGECKVALFTNSMQASHLFQVAEQRSLSFALREALAKVVVGSIGPSCSQSLHDHGVDIDVEPQEPKMARLVSETAGLSPQILEMKKNRTSPAGRLGSPVGEAIPATPITDKLESSTFMRACRCLPTEYTPIWLMRQAGRYMAEYREIRARNSFLELCKNSDLAAEVTVTAAHRLGVDAAIIFADILLIVEPMGLGLRFEKGDGPVIDGIIRHAVDVRRIREVEPQESLSFVFDAIRKTRAGLKSDIPLIGFAGAPFTLASYIVEGGASKSYRHTKSLMYREPEAWHEMMASISRSLVKYLNGQVAAGAQAVQLFDSWVGCLSPEDYRDFVLPHTRHVIEGIKKGVPVINFSTGTSAYLELDRQAGGDVIGVDWRVDLAEAWARIGHDVAVQGNLDPLVLLSEPQTIEHRARQLLEKAGRRPGHIFNLGHGILPETPVESVVALVDAVHEISSRH